MAFATVIASLVLSALMPLAVQSPGWIMTVTLTAPGMLVSPGGDYCRIPSTMPFRPGDLVRVSDESGNEIAAAEFEDSVETRGGREPYEPCFLIAGLSDLPHRDGYHLEMEANSAPAEVPSEDAVTVGWAIGMLAGDGIEITYNEDGFKICEFPSRSQLREGTEIRTDPTASPEPPFTTLMEFAQLPVTNTASGDLCSLAAFLLFPYAEKYELAVGEARPDLGSPEGQATPDA